MTIQYNNLGNEGMMSPQDTLNDIDRAQNIVLKHVEGLIGKETIVTVKSISEKLHLSEELVGFILEKNGFQMV